MKIKKDRLEFIDKWAERVKTTNDWRKHHTAFLNAQYQKSDSFYKKIILMPNGKEKFKRITGASESFTEKFFNSVKN